MEASFLLSSYIKEWNTAWRGHHFVDAFISVCGNALKCSSAISSIYMYLFTSSFLVYTFVDCYETESWLYLRGVIDIYLKPSMFWTTCNYIIYEKTNWWTSVVILIICFLVRNIYACKFVITSHVTFLVFKMHDLTVDTHIFLSFPYLMLWCKYDPHVAWTYFYMFHIYDILII